MSDTSNYYIDKEEFTNEMHAHAEECREAIKNRQPMPRCPESIGRKFLLLAQNYAKKSNFYNYPFREEMICDAVENMVRYRYNYDKRKGQAFSYFTQYAMYAFVARIKLEKKELTKKARWVQKVAVHEVIPHILGDQDVDQEFKNEYTDWLIQYYDERLDDEEKSKLKKSKPERVSEDSNSLFGDSGANVVSHDSDESVDGPEY